MFKYFSPSILLLSILFLSSTGVVLATETPTQMRAGQWQERNRVFRFPKGYIPVPTTGVERMEQNAWGFSSVGNYDPKRLMAGHLLRRLGFGPNAQEMNAVLQLGIPAYIELQLNPAQINDSRVNSLLPRPPGEFYGDYEWIQRWFTRMVYSRRQLQEKMTLILHELFATSDAKVGVGSYMHDQEDFLRRNCLGDFRTLLVGITRDQAMLIFLDNNLNNGRATDDQGKRVPPNENYAREFMQLFTLGTDRLNLDGSRVLNGGKPVPNYTEKDVREAARALTGWYVSYRKGVKSRFDPSLHDPGTKQLLGTTIRGRSGPDGAKEVDDVVNIIMRHPSLAPFISKYLIQKFATEKPTPGYVARVATVFQNTNGNMKAVVRAILTDAEFYSDAVIRSQYKEPVEHFVGALRGLQAKTKGAALIDWSYATGQLPYYPPSVFSFYPPGNKATLINTALVTIRDRVADDIIAGYSDTSFSTRDLLDKKFSLSPEQIVDRVSDALLAAPLKNETRQKVISIFKGKVEDRTIRSAIWLILCSPDFQQN